MEIEIDEEDFRLVQAIAKTHFQGDIKLAVKYLLHIYVADYIPHVVESVRRFSEHHSKKWRWVKHVSEQAVK